MPADRGLFRNAKKCQETVKLCPEICIYCSPGTEKCPPKQIRGISFWLNCGSGQGFKKRKGRRIRLPHRIQHPFQYSEPRPGGRVSEIDLVFKTRRIPLGIDSLALSGVKEIVAFSYCLSSDFAYKSIQKMPQHPIGFGASGIGCKRLKY